MARRVKPGEERGTQPTPGSGIDDLRHRLEKMAELASRSLSHEIEERLERSFDQQDLLISLFGDENNTAVLKAVRYILDDDRSFFRQEMDR